MNPSGKQPIPGAAQHSTAEWDSRSRALLDTLAAQIVVVETDGTVSATNRAWREFAERDVASWTRVSEGENFLDRCDSAAATGCDEAAVVASGIRSVLGGSVPRFETEIPRSSVENPGWFRCSAMRFQGSGPARVVIAHEDITSGKLALLESERRRDLFESLAEDSPVAIFQANADGHVHFFNNHVETLAGLPLDFLPGDGWSRFIHPEDLAAVRAAWSRVAEHRESTHFEVRVVRPNGAIRWAVVRAAPLHTAGETAPDAVGTILDVTQHKRMEGCLLCVSVELSRCEGAALYRAAVARVAELLEVDAAFVAVPVDSPVTRLRTLAIFVDGRPAQDLEFDLAATPCESAFHRESHVYPQGFRERFPRDRIAEQLEAEAYACIPLADLQGQVVGVLAVASRAPFPEPEPFPSLLQVFAARLAAEIEREKRERRFRDLVEFAPDALVMSDRSGRLVHMNQAAERLFLHSRDEILGQPIERLLPDALREIHDGHRQSFLTSPSSRSMSDRGGELLALRADGSTFPVEISLSPMETDTGVVVAAAVRDVTDRRRMERIAERHRRDAELRAGIAEAFSTEPTLESAVRATVEAACRSLELDRVEVWTFDKNGTLEKVGGAGPWRDPAPTAGTPPAEVKRSATGLWPRHWKAGDRDSPAEAPTHLLALGLSCFAGYPLIVEGTTIGALAVYSKRELDEEVTEDLAIVAAVVASNLARRSAEADLRNLADELEGRVETRTAALAAANAELDAFSASVSHDLRAPLRRIRGFVSLLSERIVEKLDPEEAEWLEAIERASAEMSDLIRDLLTAARTTRTEIREKRIDLASLAATTMRTLCEDFPDRRIDFEIGELPPVTGDPTLIQQVLVNLLGNALKYSRDRTPSRIAIGARGLTPEGRVILFVSDNGIGFEMGQATGLFGMFHRLHGARDFEGTGIGLATVKRIIEKHQGLVWAESEPGNGATFCFTLALADSA